MTPIENLCLIIISFHLDLILCLQLTVRLVPGGTRTLWIVSPAVYMNTSPSRTKLVVLLALMAP